MTAVSNGTVQGSTPIGNTLVGNPLPLAAVDSLGKVRALNIDDTGALIVTGSGGGGGGVVTQPTAALLNTTAVQGGTWNVGLSAGANAIGSVTVTSLPSLPAGANAIGSVSVSNFPATQPVSGTVTANLGTIGSAATAANQSNVQSAPGTPQTVAITVQGNASGVALPVSISGTATISGTVAATQSGTWTVGLSANQHIITDTGSTTAVTSLPSIPTGANTIGNVGLVAGSAVIGHVINDASSAVIGHVIADTGSTTAVTGNVTVVQPTGTNLHVVVDSGTITAGNASVSTTGSAVPASATMVGGTDGTNLRAINVDSAGNQAIRGNFTEVTGSASALNADLIASTDVSAYKSISVHITAQASGGITTFQGSNDGTTWFSVALMATGTTQSAPISAASTTGLYFGPIGFRYLRIRETSWTSGTASVVVELYTSPVSAVASGGQVVATSTQSGTWTVQQGSTPSTTPWAVNPVAAVTGGYSYTHISTNTTTTPKSGAGYLRSIVINTPGATDTITVYDSTTGSGTVIAVINDASASATALVYDLAFATGLTLVTAGTTAPDITVMWK